VWEIAPDVLLNVTWMLGISGKGLEKLTRALAVFPGMFKDPEVSALTFTGPWNQANCLKTVGTSKNKDLRPVVASSAQEISVVRIFTRSSNIGVATNEGVAVASEATSALAVAGASMTVRVVL